MRKRLMRDNRSNNNIDSADKIYAYMLCCGALGCCASYPVAVVLNNFGYLCIGGLSGVGAGCVIGSCQEAVIKPCLASYPEQTQPLIQAPINQTTYGPEQPPSLGMGS